MMRRAAVKGRFYPDNLHEIEELIDIWEKQLEIKKYTITAPMAVVVPHAGYIFSGLTAWAALKAVDFSSKKRVVIIGPSHRIYLDSLSICLSHSYETVEADHPIDITYSEMLQTEFALQEVKDAHYEHSTEVQIPLIHQLAPEIPIVELVYGSIVSAELEKVIEYLLQDKKNMVIISSDLSHYYNEEAAHKLDAACIEGIKNLDLKRLQACEACGRTGIEALLKAAKKLNLSSEIVDYRTSGDSVYGNKEQVVGYLSALIGEI